MTGVGDKNVKNETLPDNILTISITDEDNEEKLMLFTIENKNLKDVNDYIRHHFSDKIKTAKELEKLHGVETIENNNKVSVADELIKLKGLLDAGVLTQDEFMSQKNKLLVR